MARALKENISNFWGGWSTKLAYHSMGFWKWLLKQPNIRALLQMPCSRKTTSTLVAPFKGQLPGVVGTEHTGYIVSPVCQSPHREKTFWLWTPKPFPAVLLRIQFSEVKFWALGKALTCRHSRNEAKALAWSMLSTQTSAEFQKQSLWVNVQY